ncbi:mitochondrial chaperone BCS1 [Zalerion maritima]|uniref:Mitochondrial chaperone BCS1 n=1 Tax=Zalerion maritima TaxID=339359 RepID=A0AAD5RM04_9PEZI|nr:mitochondrial chaperone BCS1 [Zalerion maritima]
MAARPPSSGKKPPQHPAPGGMKQGTLFNFGFAGGKASAPSPTQAPPASPSSGHGSKSPEPEVDPREEQAALPKDKGKTSKTPAADDGDDDDDIVMVSGISPPGDGSDEEELGDDSLFGTRINDDTQTDVDGDTQMETDAQEIRESPYDNYSSPTRHRSRGVRRGRGRGRGRGDGGRGNRWNTQTLTPEQKAASMPFRSSQSLAAVAEETLKVLPAILSKLPGIDVTNCSEHRYLTTKELSPSSNPQFVPPRGAAPRTAVRVINQDTFDAAIELPFRIEEEDRAWATNSTATFSPAKKSSSSTSSALYGKVAVLNFASERNPGGGWRKGARAQEEALFYRSSLCQSLAENKDRHYPLRQRSALYSPEVVIVRNSMDNGHQLMHPTHVADPIDLPIVSVISVAALRRPPLKKTNYGNGRTEETFQDPSARSLTKEKMRLTLRIAGSMGHGLVVLGALGCGAFRNPPQEVAECWSEVIRETEFTGGRFRELCFAVWDKKDEGNFELFEKKLDGLQL